MQGEKTDVKRCDWCKQMYPSEMIVGVEGYKERLCPGCYRCWQKGAPQLVKCNYIVGMDKTSE